MYAIIKTGGQQFKVAPGDTLSIDRLHIEEGTDFNFDEVLLVSEGEGADEVVTVGRPHVAGATVSANVVRHLKGEKIVVFKYKRRKNYRKKKGFRAYLTEVKITDITAATAQA